jgi:hypothetical protein
MKIVEALKNEAVIDIRVSHGSRWLYFDNSTQEWVVCERRYRVKTTTEVYRGQNEEWAVSNLLTE